MSEKGGFIAIVFVILLLSVFNIYLFESKRIRFTGFATVDDETATNVAKWDFSKIAFIAQWVLILLIIYLAYIRHLRRARAEKIDVSYDSLKIKKGKAGTDIDLLYNLLKDKRKLKLSTISTVFGLKKNKALEWMKLLEEHNLATVNYPAFTEPEIELYKEHEEKETKEEIKKPEEGKAEAEEAKEAKEAGVKEKPKESDKKSKKGKKKK